MKECGELIGRATFYAGEVKLMIPVYCNEPVHGHSNHAYYDGGLVIRKDNDDSRKSR